MKWKLRGNDTGLWAENDRVKGGEQGRGWGKIVKREKERGKKFRFIVGCGSCE